MVKHYNVWFDATESAGAICQIGFREIGVGSVFDHGGNTIPIPPNKGLKLTIWSNCKTITPHPPDHHVNHTNQNSCKIKVNIQKVPISSFAPSIRTLESTLSVSDDDDGHQL